MMSPGRIADIKRRAEMAVEISVGAKADPLGVVTLLKFSAADVLDLLKEIETLRARLDECGMSEIATVVTKPSGKKASR